MKKIKKTYKAAPAIQARPDMTFFFTQPVPEMWVRAGLGLIAALAAASAGFFLYVAHSNNGFWGFPLDDPWIHLCFARNIVEFGSYSFFRDQLVTSGSTSPVYTIVLAALYGLFKNEFLISYCLGVLFFCLACCMFMKLVRRQFHNGAVIALAAGVLMALQPRLVLIAVSGMETTMFIFFMLAAFYAYAAGRGILLGALLGLTLWCRPDGIIVWIAIAADFSLRRMLRHFRPDTDDADNKTALSMKDFLAAFAISLAMAAAYCIFNYYLSGEIFPNTYKAKLALYGAISWQVFFQRDVLVYFFSREFLPLALFFLIGGGCVLYSLARGRYNRLAVYLIFSAGFVAAYCLRLPFSHRFGRYMMPLIPFYIMLSMAGLGAAAAGAAQLFKTKLAGNLLWGACAAAAVIAVYVYNAEYSKDNAFFCKYHDDRHIAAGKWIEAHTPREAIIATHDIGAIGYYGKRKILDMAGLVTPEIIPHIRDEKFCIFLEQYLNQNKATHIAVLTKWFEIVNSNPLFVPVREPEILEVHEYVYGKTHIQPNAVSAYNSQALQLALQQNNYDDALEILEQSYLMDPASSQTLLYRGTVLEMSGRYENAEQQYKKALAIFPEYVQALFSLARLYLRQGRAAEARAAAEQCLVLFPEFKPARELLAKIDSAPGQ